MSKKDRILIAGGAGFIGASLTRKLLELGHTVLVWDNLYTGKTANLDELENSKDIIFEKRDIREYAFADCDVIFNLACPASPVHYQKDPVFTWETSVLGTRNLLNLAKETGAMLIHASTSEVYGDPLEHPQKETYWGNVNPVGIRSCYDEGKRAAETVCTDYARSYDMDVRLVRIFNTYGPYMLADDGRVVSNFIVQALRGEPLTVYGDGEQTRSFCYVSDLVDGFIAMKNAEKNPQTPVNLGNPGEFTVSQLASLIAEELGNTLEIQKYPLPLDDPLRRKPDIGLAKSLLNWEPKVPLRQGIRDTIAYFKKELGLD